MRWTPHVIAILSRHPRARELSLDEVEALGKQVLPRLNALYNILGVRHAGGKFGQMAEFDEPDDAAF